MSITKEEWRAMKSLGDEAAKVTTFLQTRGHSPDEACAVMGVALAQLIDNRGMLESFIEALRAEYRVVRGLVRLAAVLLTLSATPAAAIGAKAACEGLGYLEGCQVARHRDWHSAAHLKPSNEPARGGAMTSGPQLTNSLLR